MTLPEVAEYIGVTEYQVRKLINNKKILDLGVNGNGKTRHKAVIPRESVDLYLSKTSSKPVSNNPVTSFTNRLDRIERKLDRLISMWS